ncbi:MAG: cytochrome c oxidase subunit 3 [Pseudomonadota bacterium]
MAGTKNHDYHIIDPSPWPFLGSMGALVMAFGGVVWMQSLKGGDFIGLTGPWPFLIGLAIVLYTMFGWWNDTIKESKAGDHTPVVQLHLRYGMIMFIASEVMFFVAWFWAFFDASLFADEAIQVSRVEYTGAQWPPKGLEVLDPLHLPLFNTIILLLSGTTLTWAHHALIHDDKKTMKNLLAITIALGALFMGVQAYEYAVASGFISFSGSLYGATFYMATGFHGFHVAVGAIFLFVCLIRAMRNSFTTEKHFGFEAAAWYWHFVDVVWLFLFFAVYIWGSWGATYH